MSSSISSAPVSSMKMLTNGEICGDEMHPTGVLGSPFHILIYTLQGAGIGQKPGCVVPLPWASPMFNIVGAGGHKGMVDTLAIHLHADMRCL